MARGNSSRAASEVGPSASAASQDALFSRIPIDAEYDYLYDIRSGRDFEVTNVEELKEHAQEYMQLALEGNYDNQNPKDVELNKQFEELTRELREDSYYGVASPQSKTQTTIVSSPGAPDIEMKWHLELDYVDTNKWEPSFHLDELTIKEAKQK